MAWPTSRITGVGTMLLVQDGKVHFDAPVGIYIAEVSCLPLDPDPGTSRTYSDTGYFVLGLLIERVR